MKSEKWEIELEDALCKASPEKVLDILAKLKGWLVGFCETCGVYSPGFEKINCNCEYKGKWYNP